MGERLAWRRAYIWAMLAFLLGMPLFVKSPYHLHVLIMAGLNTVLAASLALIVRTGQISFAHPAFMAIGAYTSTLLVTEVGLSYWLALVMACLAAGFVALLVGYPILRVKGAYFFLVTFAFLEIIRLIVTYFKHPFGGSRGLVRIPAPKIDLPGLLTVEFAVGGTHFYYLMIFLAVLSLFVLYRVEKGYYGRAFRAIAQNDTLAESLGINPMKCKLLAFVLGCFFAGLVGAFYAPYFTFINPRCFTLTTSIFIIIYVIVGGMGRITGAVVGAVVLTILPEVLRATGYYEMMIFAVLLILVVMFLPDGLISLPSRVLSRGLSRGARIGSETS